MKKITLMIAAVGLAGAASAGVILDDVLAIDFGATVAGTANYNHSSHAASDVADLIRLSDGAATGVGFTLTGSSQDNASNLAGNGGNTTDAGIYADGIIANLNAGAGTGNGPTLMTLTFAGLDDTLAYDLVGGLTRNSTQANPQNWGADWTADGTTISTSGIDPEGYVSFTGLTSTSGSLTITIDGTNQYSPVAQLQLTVIPEPATLGLVAAFGGGILFIRRRFMI